MKFLVSTSFVVFSFNTDYTGVRRYLLKKRLYEQMAEEVLKEESQPPPIEEYCTEYDGNFNGDGFLPEEAYTIEPEVLTLFFVHLIKHLSPTPNINVEFMKLYSDRQTLCFNAGAFYGDKIYLHRFFLSFRSGVLFSYICSSWRSIHCTAPHRLATGIVNFKQRRTCKALRKSTIAKIRSEGVIILVSHCQRCWMSELITNTKFCTFT